MKMILQNQSFGLIKTMITMTKSALEAGEPVSVRANVAPTNFQPARVDNAKLEVRDLTDAARANFRY